ncbi:MAG: S-methyl-5-thioribose-1-phosphate isomerase [Myxococcota bacterium]
MDTTVVPVHWVGGVETGYLEMLDQRKLPGEEVWNVLRTYDDVADGIRDMVIRGAPAIGIAAAYGVALAARAFADDPREAPIEERLEPVYETLSKTRPTAVNLFWALERMRRVAAEHADLDDDALVERLFDEAAAIFEEDRENNLRMGEFGAELLPEHAQVLTHCNTGGLATGGYGTALGIIRAGHASGRIEHVWVDETRPYLQGARLTAWELMKDEIPGTLITDSMAAHFMKEGQVDAVVVGTDRVVANGDVANKIGTYGLAVLCKHHGIPFYVAAPVSTIDLETDSGESIPIEQRSSDEVTRVGETEIAPRGVQVAHPAFDVTPNDLVTAIITEAGVAEAPYTESLKAMVESGES